MSTAKRYIIRVYALLLFAYPPRFRAEFGEEMKEVFAEAVAEGAKRGGMALAGLVLRELRDWLWMVLGEHWAGARDWRKGIAMWGKGGNRIAPDVNWRCVVPDVKFGSDWDIPNQREAIVATLPPLLFGLGIAANAVILGGPWYAVPRWRLILSIVAVLTPAAVVAIGGLIALIRRLPDWGYTWLGACLAGLFLLANVVGEELAESGMNPIPPAGEFAIGVLLLLVLLGALIMAALSAWQRAGLVSIGLSATMALSLCGAVSSPPFHRRDLALLAAPVGILLAVLIYVYVRRSATVQIAVVLGVGVLNVGLALIANQAWHDWLVAQGRPSPLWPLSVILTGLLLAGPVVGLLVRPLRHMVGRA